MDVLRKGVPEFWTIYLDHFGPIVYKVSPLGKKIPCVCSTLPTSKYWARLILVDEVVAWLWIT